MILEALLSQLFRLKSYSWRSKIFKIPELNLTIWQKMTFSRWIPIRRPISRNPGFSKWNFKDDRCSLPPVTSAYVLYIWSIRRDLPDVRWCRNHQMVTRLGQKLSTSGSFMWRPESGCYRSLESVTRGASQCILHLELILSVNHNICQEYLRINNKNFRAYLSMEALMEAHPFITIFFSEKTFLDSLVEKRQGHP